MAAFSGTVAALLAGKKVNATALFTATFKDGQVVRLWTGHGNITIGGNLYKGSGRLISVENLKSAIGTGVPNTTFKMSGVDPDIAALAVKEKDLIRGSTIKVVVQVFGDGKIASEWQPIDSPIGIGVW